MTGDQTCARGSWCSDPRIIREPDGSMTRLPALTPRPFCEPDRSMVANCLEALPSAWERLNAELGERSRTGNAVRVPPGPRLPLRADVDALMRLTADILASWHERVAAVARLSAPDTLLSRLNHGSTVKTAATILHAHLDALLSLPAEPMARIMTPAAAAELTDGGVVRHGDAHVLLPLSGADAGLEILSLHYRARKVLGETRSAPETFDGIPCRSCEDMALERAEPPSDPSAPAMHSRCASCGHTMDRQTYCEWAAWSAEWAKRMNLTCRRCAQGRHDECVYDDCACRHAVALSA